MKYLYLFIGLGLGVLFCNNTAKSQDVKFICKGGMPYKDTGKIELRYDIWGTDWDCRFLTYFFVNGTADIGGSQEQGAIEDAMDTWSAVTNIDFLEACNAGDADIRISWGTGNHGDNGPFDGNACTGGGDLAHAFFPPPNSGLLAGDVHFDDDEVWSMNGDANCNNIDLESVALHELGHSLGLDESNVTNSVMRPYNGQRRNLFNDDRNGIRAIYGHRSEYPIIGQGIMCQNSSRNFSIDCLSNNVDVTWSVTPNLQITSGQGTWEVSIKASGSGTGTLTATMSTGCDNIQYDLDIQIISGIPNYTLIDITDDSGTRYLEACEITNGEASYSGSGPIYEYEWDIPYATDWFIESINSPFTPYETVEIDYYEDPPPSTEAIRVRARNECGWSWWQEKTWTVIDQCNSPFRDSTIVEEENNKDEAIKPEEPTLSLTMYPTVSRDEVRIQWVERYNQKKYAVKIYDRQGRLMREIPDVGTDSYLLSVHDLPGGLYFCRIHQGSSHIWKKFIVME